MKNKPSRFCLLILGFAALAVLLGWLIVNRNPDRSVLWVGNSQEYQAVCLQIYRQALEQLKQDVFGLSKPWAVVMDIDDTCLSTVDYQRAGRLQRLPILGSSWEDWCRQERGVVVPGALEFSEKVRELGGLVVLLTDRREELRAITEDNLRREGIIYDVLLMRNKDSAKPQWREFITGDGGIPGLGPVEVAMVIGDKIGDFYAGGNDRGHYDDWGAKFIIIPNPMKPTSEDELE